MAIVKPLTPEREPKQLKVGLGYTPEVKSISHTPKSINLSWEERKRKRAGSLGPLSLKGKPTLIEDGKKLK